MNLQLHTSLSKLVGTWRTTGQIIGGPDAGQSWSGYDVYEWFPGEQHLVHRVDVTIGGQRSEGLEVFTPRDESSLDFDQISFNSDGSIERAEGTFDAEGRYHNDLPSVRATVTFEDADHMRAAWEQRDVEGAWTPWMDVRFVREGAPHVEVRSKGDHSA